MKENAQSARQDSWVSRLWRTLVAWDDAINIGPVESIEWRVSVSVIGYSRQLGSIRQPLLCTDPFARSKRNAHGRGLLLMV